MLNNDFFESLNLPLSRKTIVLIDFDNQHGLDMYSLLSNSSLYPELNRIKIKWHKIYEENDLYNILQQYTLKTDSVLCIPLCWKTSKYNSILNTIAKHNIIVAPYDKDNLYPWSLPEVFCAKENIEWYYPNENNQQIQVSGYSVDTVLLSIIALKGKQYLNNFLKRR